METKWKKKFQLTLWSPKLLIKHGKTTLLPIMTVTFSLCLSNVGIIVAETWFKITFINIVTKKSKDFLLFDDVNIVDGRFFVICNLIDNVNDKKEFMLMLYVILFLFLNKK